ncbi:MAG TPA: ribonuclease III [Trichocoleus sp.]|jgi:ribonuclease-3
MSNILDLPSFRNFSLFQQAMTHRSYVNEHPATGEHNERLEFLGDAILNFLSGHFLYQWFPEKPEGELTPLRSSLTDEKQLAEFAIALNLGDQLRLGKGAELNGGRHNPNLLSSAFEAMIGAYFLDADSDMETVRAYVEPLFGAVIDRGSTAALTLNFKSQFQAWALAEIGENPAYSTIGQTGPDHDRTFTAEVRVKDQKYGEGQGRRKQDAEKAAARDALDRLGLMGEGK